MRAILGNHRRHSPLPPHLPEDAAIGRASSTTRTGIPMIVSWRATSKPRPICHTEPCQEIKDACFHGRFHCPTRCALQFIHWPPGNREAQAGSAVPARRRSVGLRERLILLLGGVREMPIPVSEMLKCQAYLVAFA